MAAQSAKIAWKEHSKPLRVKPPATTVPADGGTQAMDRLVATQYHRGRTLWMVSKPFANVVTFVPVQMHHKRLVQKVHIQTTRVPSPAFPVHRVHFPAQWGMSNATGVLWDIYNRNQNNRLATK